MSRPGVFLQSRRAFLRRVTGQAGVPRDLLPDITPNAAFFTAGIGPVPLIDRRTWTLTVDGLVDTPLRLDWDAVCRLPAVETMQTVACIGNGHTAAHGSALIGNAIWRGVPVPVLLAQAGLQPEARRACFYAADGYSTGVDLWWLARAGAILAYMMNGEPLPAAHGAPLRLLVPGLYGQKMPKWITRIALVDYPYAGHWERRGWSDVAAVKTRALFRQPAMFARVTGVVELQGVAYAGDRPITGVEVSVEEGVWLEATLIPPAAPAAWTRWFYRWEPNAPGSYLWRVRATDARGFTQTDDSADRRAFPAGVDTIDRLIVLVP